MLCCHRRLQPQALSARLSNHGIRMRRSQSLFWDVPQVLHTDTLVFGTDSSLFATLAKTKRGGVKERCVCVCVCVCVCENLYFHIHFKQTGSEISYHPFQNPPFPFWQPSFRGLSGIAKHEKQDYFTGTWIIHLDCFAWVQRDSYLPCGARGLKALDRRPLGSVACLTLLV